MQSSQTVPRHRSLIIRALVILMIGVPVVAGAASLSLRAGKSSRTVHQSRAALAARQRPSLYRAARTTGCVQLHPGPLVFDANTRGYRRMQVLVVALEGQQKPTLMLVTVSSAADWAHVNEVAFTRAGRAPGILFLDQLKSGSVLDQSIYDPAHNAAYRDLLQKWHVETIVYETSSLPPEDNSLTGAKVAVPDLYPQRFPGVPAALEALEGV